MSVPMLAALQLVWQSPSESWRLIFPPPSPFPLVLDLIGRRIALALARAICRPSRCRRGLLAALPRLVSSLPLPCVETGSIHPLANLALLGDGLPLAALVALSFLGVIGGRHGCSICGFCQFVGYRCAGRSAVRSFGASSLARRLQEVR